MRSWARRSSRSAPRTARRSSARSSAGSRPRWTGRGSRGPSSSWWTRRGSTRSGGRPASRWRARSPATPLGGALELRILDVLEREGKALVALNTLLLAGDLHEEIVAHKVRIRNDAANRMIWNFALAKGAAVALNPIPVADMAGGLAVDVGMIIALSKVYGIPLTRRTASGLVKDMMVALGTLGA